jgi:catalase
MAVKLRPGSAETDILATMAPTFTSRTPEDFLELLRLRRPDPETGQPDMEKLGAYLGEHPEAQPAIQGVLGVEPPASFATIPYYSPHAFRLVDGEGNGTWVRYRWRPEAGEQRIGDEEARERGRDYLREELAERLRTGPAAFELLFQVAAEGDPLDDPTAVWPEERDLVSAGRLEVTKLIADPEAGGDVIVFDPTRVIDGIELPDDPVLHARPRAYSVSVERRSG